MFGKKSKVMVLYLILLSFLFSGIALADGNARKGKYLFRKHCRTCHSEDSTGDKAGKALSPNSKTQAQWEAAFKTYTSLPCVSTWETLKAKGRADVYAYLWGHAYDSPSPAKCE